MIHIKNSLIILLLFSFTSCNGIVEKVDGNLMNFRKKIEKVDSLLNEELVKMHQLDTLMNMELKKVKQLDSLVINKKLQIDSLISK